MHCRAADLCLDRLGRAGFRGHRFGASAAAERVTGNAQIRLPRRVRQVPIRDEISALEAGVPGDRDGLTLLRRGMNRSSRPASRTPRSESSRAITSTSHRTAPTTRMMRALAFPAAR